MDYDEDENIDIDAEVLAYRAMNIKLILSDVDGVLVIPKDHVTDIVAAALKKVTWRSTMRSVDMSPTSPNQARHSGNSSRTLPSRTVR